MSTQRDVRLWAQSKGFPVPDRGDLPVAVVAGYNAQHPDDPYVRKGGRQWSGDPISADADRRHDQAIRAANTRWHGRAS